MKMSWWTLQGTSAYSHCDPICQGQPLRPSQHPCSICQICPTDLHGLNNFVTVVLCPCELLAPASYKIQCKKFSFQCSSNVHIKKKLFFFTFSDIAQLFYSATNFLPNTEQCQIAKNPWIVRISNTKSNMRERDMLFAVEHVNDTFQSYSLAGLSLMSDANWSNFEVESNKFIKFISFLAKQLHNPF